MLLKVFLPIDGRNERGLGPHAHQVHPVEVLGQQQGLHHGKQEQACCIEYTSPHYTIIIILYVTRGHRNRAMEIKLISLLGRYLCYFGLMSS